MSDYHINVFYSEEDRGYVADIPDLKSCSAFGDTPEQAVHEAIIAKEARLKTPRARHKPIAPPRYWPPMYSRD